MLRFFFTLLVFLSIGSTFVSMAAPNSETRQDTLLVKEAYRLDSHRLQSPFIMDSVNVRGDAFEQREVLSYNRHLARLAHTTTSPKILQGVGLDNNSLHILRFVVDAERWTKVVMKVPKIKHFETYLNGTLQSSPTLKFSPGRNEISLFVLSDAQSHDTFNISLIGEQLQWIKLNPTDAPKYGLMQMTYGPRFSNISLSPSGRYVITTYQQVHHNGETQAHTVVTDLHTGKVLQRTNGYSTWHWLPRRDVLYTSRSTPRGETLLTLQPETLQEKVLAEGLPKGTYIITPNETKVLIIKKEDGTSPNGGIKQLLHPDDRMPNWRKRNSLFVYDFQTRYLQRLIFGKENITVYDIAPNSSKVLLGRYTMKPERTPFTRTDIWELHLSTGKVDTLLTEQIGIKEGQYSPDGKHILFTATPNAFNGIGSEVQDGQHAQGFDHRLFLYDPTHQRVTPLLRNFNPSVSEAKWHSADDMIYMKCVDGYDETLWRLNPKTGTRFRFELPLTYIKGYGIANAKHPKAVFFGQSATIARNAYTTTLSSSRPKCSPFGEIDFQTLYDKIRLPSNHTWSFQTSRGDSIKGFYYLPTDFDAQKSYPMIVYYYGGCMPTTRALEFHYPLSVLANMGYVVLVVEPSGAIGFGQEFAARHVNTWGKMSADDIIEGTQRFCEEHPYVNTQKIGCMGASYGGFMTEYLQTQTNIFAAAISHAGISNIASYWGGGYWGYTYGEVAMYGSYPWNNSDLYLKQSPIFHADKINTPLLLLHGTHDTNVPTNESQQLYTALRILGKEVSYLQIAGADHVVTEHTQRLQWQNAIMAWFAKYLQDDDRWWKDLGFQ